MFNTSESTESITRPKKDRTGVGDDGKAEFDNRYKLGNEIEDDEVMKKDQKTSKFNKLSKSKKTIGSLDFFILEARLAFTELKQVFVKASIFHHFNLKRHIWIETNASVMQLVEFLVT